MAHHLTDSLVAKLPLPDHGNRITYDDALPGFGVRATAGGARSFVLRYRVRGSGQQRTHTIGSTTSWNIASARREAKRLRTLIDAGGDPVGDIQTERAEPTMGDLIARFEEEHLPRKRPGTIRGYQTILRNHIEPHFGRHTKVTAVTFADCDALHRAITKAGSPYAANRTKAVLHKMFDLAEKWGWRTGTNPARHIESNFEQQRKRYLVRDELPRLLAALAEYPNQQVANILRVCLLTGCRRSEARAMKWDDVDLKKGVWTKPASTTKQKSDHVVPLSAPVRQLLSKIAAEQRDARSDFVFPSPRGDGHSIELKNHWARLCATAKIDGLRVHDLRHSVASELASSGANLPLIARLLGHASVRTTERYAHLFDDPLRLAAEKVGAIMSGAPAVEPTPLSKKRRWK